VTTPVDVTVAMVESLVLHASGCPVTTRPDASCSSTSSAIVAPGAMVGAAGETITHFASERGVLVEAAGSSMAEHATRAAQLTRVSALREFSISKVLTGSSGNPTDVVRAAHLSLVGFASPSFDGFAFVAGLSGP